MNKIKSFLIALFEFSILAFGYTGIFIYAESNASHGGTDAHPAAAGIGVIIQFLFFSFLLTIIWYSTVLYLHKKSQKQNRTTIIRAHRIAMMLPVISFVVLLLIWFIA